MRKAAEKYYKDLAGFINSLRVTDGANRRMDFHLGIERAGGLIVRQAAAGRKMMFIGNGASAAISSHMSTDFWKNGGIRAVAFNDSSVLTCIGNDYGYRHIFEKPIGMFADEGDILVAISSSGRSENILLGVEAARQRRCEVITLSGFSPDNPLSSMGDINFYVAAQAYGPVEVLHHSICHCILDVIMGAKNG
ncbi:MAG: SIS domain-containing protein [Thermodesulfovibrionales bacterium]|nr:SIS domain-containing protein [Thermodesulfovibrionales bacterium]